MRVSDQDYALCSLCEPELPWLCPPYCTHCLQALEQPGAVCGDCQKAPPYYDSLTALFAYKEPITSFISQLKFKDKLSFAHLFAMLLCQRVANTKAQVILPVPLHPNRQQSRGYNQALEIARPLKRAFKIPILPDALRRTRDTPQQLKLKKSERYRNVSGAFSLKTDFSYQHVALVDDTYTTGHTVNALSRLLKSRGVQRIEVWCVARVA